MPFRFFFLLATSPALTLFLAIEAEIMPGYRTGLSMVTIRITTTNPRGPGLWKVNTHLLPETAYVDLIAFNYVERTHSSYSLESRLYGTVNECGSWDAYLAPPADFAGADDIITKFAKEREPGIKIVERTP